MTNKRKINFLTCNEQTFFQYSFTKVEHERGEEEKKICPYCGKSRYTYEEAMHVMKAIKTGKENRSHNRIFLRAYKCKGWWHLTSTKTEKGQRKLKYCA